MRILAALSFLTLTICPALAWVDSGHMVIAAIAYRHLTSSARAEADRLLQIGGTPQTNDFVTAACWADDIKSERRETGPWHYIDIHFRADGAPDNNKPDAENVVWALHKFVPILADRSRPDAERAEALRFILHFVGDIHQPLHAVSRDTDALPNGDAGGNRFRIQTPASMQGIDRPPHNLHIVWDLGGGLFPSTNRGYRPLDKRGRDEIGSIATKVEQEYPMKRLGPFNPEAWANESSDIAKTIVYDLPEGSQPSDGYLARAQKVSAARAAQAGYRLASLLNQTLK